MNIFLKCVGKFELKDSFLKFKNENIPLFWQIIVEEFVNLKIVLRTLIKLNYCGNTNSIFQSQKWFAKSRKLHCILQITKKFNMVLVPAVSQYQMAVYILCLLQGYLWRPIIFCFKSNEKVPDKSLSTALTAHQNGIFFVFFIGEVIVTILDL